MTKMMPTEEDDTQESSHSESSDDFGPSAPGLHVKVDESPEPSTSSLAFFCKKRAPWLLGCLSTMVLSAALFVLNKFLGRWQLKEEIADDGSMEKSYEPGNNCTFLVLVLSIFMFQASLSVLLVLFVYVYKRDVQEQQNKSRMGSSQEMTLADEYALLQIEQPHLFSSFTPQDEPGMKFKETFLYYFYQKHAACVQIISFLLLASLTFLILPQASTTHFSLPLLVGLVFLVSSCVMASCLLWFHLDRTVRRYQSRRSFQRRLSLDCVLKTSAYENPPKGSQVLLQLLNFQLHATVFWVCVVRCPLPVWSFILVLLLSSVACLSWYLWNGSSESPEENQLETCSETEPVDDEAAEMV
jgi:hypothetical protein